jgi:S-formylglutathione hydrolase
MRFAVYSPPQAKNSPVPVLWYLSGLTCTWANVMEKSGIQKYAAEHGLMIVAPDTSPRGEDVPDDAAYDLGQGAGFYLTATEDPWAKFYRMDQYITGELSVLIADNFPADMDRQGITGHSMGGHGAITLHLKHPTVFQSCSAFSPIVSPARVPWGQKALETYLGPKSVAWDAYDSTELVKAHQTNADILIDQGDVDQFLAEQLDPSQFLEEARKHGQAVTHRMQPGYDHSYYFVASFLSEHVAWHADKLH